MPSVAPAFTPARIALAVLLGGGALNAFGGGYYGMRGAQGVPTAWLEGTPFDTYFVPSLVLFGVVGGAQACAAILVLRGHRLARRAAFAAGATLLGWIATQLALIGYVSWLQPAVLGAALTILALSRRATQATGL